MALFTRWVSAQYIHETIPCRLNIDIISRSGEETVMQYVTLMCNTVQGNLPPSHTFQPTTNIDTWSGRCPALQTCNKCSSTVPRQCS